MVVEVHQVLGQHALEVEAVEDQHPVDQLSADDADPSFGDRVWPASSTTPDCVAAQRVLRVTHPFHPSSGREFVFVAVRQSWAEDRVFFLDRDGRQYSLPVGWTDAAGPDVFVTVATGRCPFRMVDLLALARMIEGCPLASETCV
jgi:Family of unknown function (DUF5372)